jgi:hypothetical protein
MKFYGDKIPLKFYNNINETTLFEGLYFQEDYNIFMKHLGERVVFWNGSDTLRLLSNLSWIEIIQKYSAKHYCHNIILKKELKSVGIDATIVPLFFGDKEDYQVCYKHSEIPQVFMNAHPGREQEYGVDKCLRLAEFFPYIIFHIYGIDGESKDNIVYHGQIPETQMDDEIKNYQGVLRFNEHDGMSQIVAKASLMGLYDCVSTDLDYITEFLRALPNTQKSNQFDRNSIKDIKEFLEMIK